MCNGTYSIQIARQESTHNNSVCTHINVLCTIILSHISPKVEVYLKLEFCRNNTLGA